MHMSLKLIQAGKLLRFDPANGWPESLSITQAIQFQTWHEGIAVREWGAKADDLSKLFGLDHSKGAVKVTTTSHTKKVERSKNIEVTFSSVYWDGTPGKRRMVHWTEDVEVKTHHTTAGDFAAWLAANDIEPSPLVAAWCRASGVVLKMETAALTEGKEKRQDRRLQACIDDGLEMDARALLRLPDGVGRLAAKEGVKRQTFTEDVKAALKRKVERERPKPRLVRPK
jgi:hypothetical protein